MTRLLTFIGKLFLLYLLLVLVFGGGVCFWMGTISEKDQLIGLIGLGMMVLAVWGLIHLVRSFWKRPPKKGDSPSAADVTSEAKGDQP